MTRDLKDYQEQYANQPYEKYQVAFRKRKLKSIFEHNHHATLLEVGCGLESIFQAIDSYEKIVVVEPSDIFFEKAKLDRASHPNKEIILIKGLLEEVGEALKSFKFDFILVSCLLHEIPNQSLFLNTLHSLCHEDTIMHINVPNAQSFHRYLAVEMGLIKSVFEMSSTNIQFQQHTVFDMTTLCQLVENQGFEVLEKGSYSFKPFTHGQMQAMLDANLLTEQMLDGFYGLEKYIPDLGSEIYINVKKVK